MTMTSGAAEAQELRREVAQLYYEGQGSEVAIFEAAYRNRLPAALLTLYGRARR